MKATFAAGCFWCVEPSFSKIKGVTSTMVGYTGGRLENPTYEDVCTGQTGHAEAIQVEYDPSVVSYDEILEVFWSSHDPTTLNRQGPDVGEQYRSAIFFHSAEQEAAAKASKEKLQNSGMYEKNVVTQIAPASPFYKA
ncbi:MAG: peptide-methionine (S)-S-oxide reductase MsrA, partial [Nitrosopumilaceae archaeon]